MSRRIRQLLLAFTALLSATLLVVVLTNRDLLRDEEPSGDLTAWLADHPADWISAGAISDAALDSDSPRRVELWRRAYAHAHMLAPNRPNTAAAFVRGGLFHWYELSEEDRARVLAAAGPLLRDPPFFTRMHIPLFQLTRNFELLRRNAPDTVLARHHLRDLALSRGLFDDYRELREELRQGRIRQLDVQRKTVEPTSLLELLPERIDRGDDALVRGILEEFDRKAFDSDKVDARIEWLADYAVRHDMQPLTGIFPLLEPPTRLRDVTRARVALDLNRPEVATRIEITSSSVADAAQWEPYYLDRARYEAVRNRNAATADSYLARAALRGMSLPVIAAAREVAATLGKANDVARFDAMLAKQQRTWRDTCGKDELCASARTFEYGTSLRIELATTQSDGTPPYVEIYVDDLRRAEGEVRDTRVFELNVPDGLHDVEVRLVNPRTRNGIQRRVRLS